MNAVTGKVNTGSMSGTQCWCGCSSEWFLGEGVNENLVTTSSLKHRNKVGQVTTGSVEVFATLPLELAG
jgi:hypothetical protein